MMVLGQYGAVLVGSWWCWVSRRRYWLIFGGTVWGGFGWYLVVLGQHRAVLVDIRCNWVSMERNWSIHDNTGPVEGSTG